MKAYTISNFNAQFPDDDACLEWLRHKLYPAKIYCQSCKRPTKHHRISNRKVYGCDFCGHQISPTTNTIFHKSPTPLRLWFYAIFLMSSTRCGISAKQIERETGVTYKTAWRMFKEIRTLLNESPKPLTGEVDETYIGGKRPGKRGRGAEGKTPVVGAAQRKGKVVAKAVPHVKRSTLVPFMRRRVSPEATLYTDEFPAYDHMARLGYKHLRIEHGAKIYALGHIHTNSIEGFWSLVKRGISGVYHTVSPKYLQSYLDEYTFRYNHRKDDAPMFEVLLDRVRYVLPSA